MPPPPPPLPEEIPSSSSEEESEEEEPKVSDMVVDPEHDVSRERSRSVSAAARLPLATRTATGLGQEDVRRGSSSAAAEAAAASTTSESSSAAAKRTATPGKKDEEASSSLKRPHSASKGSAAKRGQSVPSRKATDDGIAWSLRRKSMTWMTEELWSHLDGKATKIDFTVPGDGATGAATSPGAGEPQGGAPGKIPVQQQYRMVCRQRKEWSRRGVQGAPPRSPRQQDEQHQEQHEEWGQKRGPGAPPRGQRASRMSGRAPAREGNMVGAIGHEDAVPLPEWLARLATSEEDEATHHVDLVSVKHVEWAIQHTDSNGGFQGFDSGNLVKYNWTASVVGNCSLTWRKLIQERKGYEPGMLTNWSASKNPL